MAAVTAARDAGYAVVAIELTGDAVPLFDLVPSTQPIALIVGHEERGVHKDTLAVVNQTAFLPLVGNIGSLNVGHTATAALAEIRRQGWLET